MRSYRFGPFLLDVQERRLLRNGDLVPLTPKVFDTLVYLVEHQGHLVTKDEVMQAIWSDCFVEDGNLPRTIHVLRRALGTDGNDLKYIETVPTKGYRFVGDVAGLDGNSVSAQLAVVSEQLNPQVGRIVSSSKRVLIGAVTSLLLLAIVMLVAGSGWRTVERNDALKFLRVKTDSGAAYTKYQTGRLYMDRHRGGDYAEALQNFEAAIKLDPHFAAAYAGKADAEIFLYWNSGSHDDIALARLAISKALELDPNSSYAHTLLCRIRATYDWDFAGAKTECSRAVELDPENHQARSEYAFLLNSMGRRDEALKEMDVAIAIAPTSFNKRSRGLLLYFARRYDEAIAQLKQVEATDPEYSESSRWIARSLEQEKDYSHALEFLIRFRESDGARPEETALLRRAFETGGWTEVLRASIPKQPKPNLESAGSFAELGEKDKAFEVLEGMIRDRRVMIVHMDSEPRLDSLRSDPRYELLAQRVGLR